MRKILPLLALATFYHFSGYSQPRAYESKTEFQKTQQTAAAIDLPYTTDLVDEAIRERMSRKGLKGSSQKGFTLYRGAVLGRAGDSAAGPADLYVKVDRKNRDKTSSVVTIIAARPGEDPATRTAADPALLEDAKFFLNDLSPSVEARSLEGEVTGQESVVKKAQKKLHGLQDDQTSLEKKLRYAQGDLEQNKKDQVTQAAALQAGVNTDAEATKKAQKKMNKLLDDQGSLQKKIRNYQTDLEENKKDQELATADLKKQQDMLGSIKGRRK